MLYISSDDLHLYLHNRPTNKIKEVVQRGERETGRERRRKKIKRYIRCVLQAGTCVKAWESVCECVCRNIAWDLAQTSSFIARKVIDLITKECLMLSLAHSRSGSFNISTLIRFDSIFRSRLCCMSLQSTNWWHEIEKFLWLPLISIKSSSFRALSVFFSFLLCRFCSLNLFFSSILLASVCK